MSIQEKLGRRWGKTLCILTALFIVLILLYHKDSIIRQRCNPTWESLDARPLPNWYDEAKLGIFIHWGLYSVPSFGIGDRGAAGEWFWWNWKGRNQTAHIEFMKKNYRHGFQYKEFAPQFTAESFNPNDWAKLFKDAGARYVVLTSKHHDGYANWPSKLSPEWNSMEVGPHRDIVGDLARAVRKQDGLRFGLYYSLMEWFNPMYISDRANDFKTSEFVNKKISPELHDIVNTYKPEIVWSDGDRKASHIYWKSRQFLQWLYNDSPVRDTVVTNDRWGLETTCAHGGFLTCTDRYSRDMLSSRKWENAMTIDRLSWGYRHNAEPSDYLSIEEIIQTFVKTISCGGNMLMNIGPKKDGTIPPIYQDRLRQMGQWLDVVGEAVYATVPWSHQNDTLTAGVWYTAKGSTVYAFLFAWPKSGFLDLGIPEPNSDRSEIAFVGVDQSLSWTVLKPSGISVDLRGVIKSALPYKWAWVLRLRGFR